ncbi:unnamed protein product [Adineta steineri]|uniref:PDZ domain-containing protein n=1 Tax=Adineta steineri TaxID=433720 RepID=A0A818MV77_9BILA|nr:unnamed protein product [Adineta steineri]CAF3595252.1 unnamed protein product [Adineta steineri]
MSNNTQFNYKEHWQEIEIILEKNLNSDDKSLGFTISGGIDKPVHKHFTSIVISHIYENTVADRIEQLKLYDIILRVNDIDITNMKQETVVDILKRSGEQIKLFIRRLSPPIIKTIELQHNGRLGIRITGGIGNESIPDDHGIFIKHIDTFQTNKWLEMGDRLLQISAMCNTYDLRFVTYEMAKKYIESACALNQKIKLCIGRSRSPVQLNNGVLVLDEDSYHFKDSKSKDCDTLTHHYDEIDEMNEENLITTFNSDDYHRYEKYGKNIQKRLSNKYSFNNSEMLSQAEIEQSSIINASSFIL